MIKYIIKSAFLLIPLTFIAFAVYAMSEGVCEMIEENFSSAIFVLPLMCAVLIWIFTRLVAGISESMSFLYWAFCVAMIFVLKQIPLSEYESLSFMAPHITALMFLIPEMEGEWTTYFNTEVTISDSEVVSTRSWFSEEYMPGCFKKLITMIGLCAAILVLTLMQGESFLNIVFWIEIIYSGILAVTNLGNFFFGD